MPRKLTKQILQDRVLAISPNISIIGDYESSHAHILCECLTCGNIWNGSATKLLSGRNCPECAKLTVGNKLRKPLESFIEELSTILPTIKLIGEYKTNHTKTLFRCSICGNEWMAEPNNLMAGKGCPSCWRKRQFGLRTKSNDWFVSELAAISPTITALSEYTGCQNLVELECGVCGHVWSARPSKLIGSAHGCPICACSHGEKIIARYLRSKNISFEPQQKFDGLVGLKGGPLSYDFYLPLFNTLIEYQGEYHDREVPSRSHSHNLWKQKEHDKRKREYAESHQIRLLEIWYYDSKNMIEILDAELAY